MDRSFSHALCILCLCYCLSYRLDRQGTMDFSHNVSLLHQQIYCVRTHVNNFMVISKTCYVYFVSEHCLGVMCPYFHGSCIIFNYTFVAFGRPDSLLHSLFFPIFVVRIAVLILVCNRTKQHNSFTCAGSHLRENEWRYVLTVKYTYCRSYTR